MEERIIEILNARGLQATQYQVFEWFEDLYVEWIKKHGYCTRDSFKQAVTEAIEDGQKTWTMCLHVRFGDAK